MPTPMRIVRMFMAGDATAAEGRWASAKTSFPRRIAPQCGAAVLTSAPFMLVEAGPSAEFAAALGKGHILQFARCPFSLPHPGREGVFPAGLARSLAQEEARAF